MKPSKLNASDYIEMKYRKQTRRRLTQRPGASPVAGPPPRELAFLSREPGQEPVHPVSAATPPRRRTRPKAWVWGLATVVVSFVLLGFTLRPNSSHPPSSRPAVANPQVSLREIAPPDPRLFIPSPQRRSRLVAPDRKVSAAVHFGAGDMPLFDDQRVHVEP